MKLTPLLTLNAILFLALGIAFAMYAPLMLAFFQVPELPIDTATYWHVAAFARLFGALLFSLGLLLWALRATIAEAPTETRRRTLLALILGNLMSGLVAITQQSSIWLTPAGWVGTGLFFAWALLYILVLLRPA